MKPARYLAAAALASALALGGYALTTSQNRSPAVTLTLLDGRKLALQDLRGQVVLVNFWATSCSTCVKEMPELVRTYERFHDRGLRTVGVAMSYDPPAYVMAFAQSRQLPFDVAMDLTGTAAEGFGHIQATPTTFVIDREGRIVKRYVGPPDFAALHQLLDQLLAGSGTGPAVRS